VGCGLAGIVFQNLREAELKEFGEQFSIVAGSYQYVVKREIESNLAAVIALRAYFEVTADVNPENFSRYAIECMKAFPSVSSLEWAPRILSSERPEFEAGLARDGKKFPYIRNGLNLTPPRADRRDEYFPVKFMYPAPYADRVVGYDLATTEPIRAVLAQAADDLRLTAAGPVPLVEKSGRIVGVPVYAAVYTHGNEGGQLRGYVLAIFQIADVIEQGLRKLKPEPVDIQFYDLSAAPTKRLLYSHNPGTPAHEGTPGEERAALRPDDLKKIARFDVGGRPWAMVLRPTPDYLRRARTWKPWNAFALVLALTGITAGYLWSRISHARREAELRHLRSRRAAEEALRRSDERYALAAEGSKDGLWDWDFRSGEVFYSQRWKAMLGYSDHELGSDPEVWLKRIHPKERRRVEEEIEAHRAGRIPHFQIEHRVLHRDGSYRWFLSRGVAVFDSKGIAQRMAGSQTDITDGKTVDPLTGLGSRILLDERLTAAIQQSKESDQPAFAVMFLDIDRFKLVNDSLGHLAGDQLLVEVAGRLRDAVRSAPVEPEQITLARLGGDEFAVLACGLQSESDATVIAETIRCVMAREFSLDGNKIFVSFSIGVRIGDDTTTSEDHLRDADIAMYEAKAAGKGRCAVFDPPMRLRVHNRLRTETELRRSIENGELLLHYQPKVSLPDCRLTGFEALVRWNHPERGMVMPSEFIPTADETGLVVPLGNWVLDEACRQLANWQQKFPAARDLRISVNLSCRQLRQEALVAEMDALLVRTGLSAENLELEITESVLMENFEDARLKLTELRERGVRLSIDDFGTGYSSLNYLHRLPIDEVKIDRSFISAMTHNTENFQIVRTIVLLARTLGMKVIAEGVENADQLDQLKKLRCDGAQGYFFDKPLSAERIERMLEQSTARETFDVAAVRKIATKPADDLSRSDAFHRRAS
jgi:diguanylate cyclase (GGDEF)-like protein/PAS domain S-box-containing protein